MSTVHALKMKSEEIRPVENDLDLNHIALLETHYCDYSHKEIARVAESFSGRGKNARELVMKLFLHVRDTVIFGGDRWKVKASETLEKGYGACYNKNLLLVALLRYHGIPSKFCANPMAKDFNKAAMGFGHLTVSTPFYHCFTKVSIDGAWVDIDPTFDKHSYNTFFGPLGVDWGVDWDGFNDMLLYKGSVIGDPRIYDDIDDALDRNLDSHFLFGREPEFLVSLWLSMGNSMMWSRTRKK